MNTFSINNKLVWTLQQEPKTQPVTHILQLKTQPVTHILLLLNTPSLNVSSSYIGAQQQDKATCRDIKSILRKHGIDRGAHHGCELIRGNCRLLMSKADSIFEEIQN